MSRIPNAASLDEIVASGNVADGGTALQGHRCHQKVHAYSCLASKTPGSLGECTTRALFLGQLVLNASAGSITAFGKEAPRLTYRPHSQENRVARAPASTERGVRR